MNKDLLIKSVESLDSYSSSQRKILQKIIEISVNNTSIVSKKYLSEKTGYAHNTVYTSLRNLLKEKVISKIEKNTYFLNEEKLENILEVYKKKMVDLPLPLAS